MVFLVEDTDTVGHAITQFFFIRTRASLIAHRIVSKPRIQALRPGLGSSFASATFKRWGWTELCGALSRNFSNPNPGLHNNKRAAKYFDEDGSIHGLYGPYRPNELASGPPPLASHTPGVSLAKLPSSFLVSSLVKAHGDQRNKLDRKSVV